MKFLIIIIRRSFSITTRCPPQILITQNIIVKNIWTIFILQDIFWDVQFFLPSPIQKIINEIHLKQFSFSSRYFFFEYCMESFQSNLKSYLWFYSMKTYSVLIVIKIWFCHMIHKYIFSYRAKWLNDSVYVEIRNPSQ